MYFAEISDDVMICRMYNCIIKGEKEVHIMGFLAFIFMMLIPVGFAGLIVFDIFIATKKISSVSKRTR